MPAVAKTSEAEIVGAAKAIIAEDGVDDLSLGRVSAAVGIKAPSLYKRFIDRAALIAAVREDVLRQLGAALAVAAGQRDPVKRAAAMARAYRRFALANPRLYRLVQASGGEASPAAREVIAPVFAALTAIVGEDLALPAARCLTAYLHGFATMEIDRNFQLGGSVDEAFEFGLEAIMRGLGPPRRAGKR